MVDLWTFVALVRIIIFGPHWTYIAKNKMYQDQVWWLVVWPTKYHRMYPLKIYNLPSQHSTHSCTASFFSSFSSCLGPLNVDCVAVVWTPCDVISSPALFWSGAEGDGDSAAGLPGLLVFVVVVVVDGAGTPPGVPAAITTTPSSLPSRPTVEALSRGRSLGLSAGSLGGLVIIWSKAGSEFELDCNWKREGEKSG